MNDLPDFGWQREYRLFADATAVLWRAVQQDELCDLTECVHKRFGSVRSKPERRCEDSATPNLCGIVR